jgi:hypothetical protein
VILTDFTKSVWQRTVAVHADKRPEVERCLSMKTRIALSVIMVALVIGCTENYGQPMTGELPRITVMSALTDHSLVNQGVIIEGIILTQCQASGCWFFLKDETGRILIDLAPSNFTITANRVGKKAMVKGIVSEAEGQIKIIGKEVTIH